MEAMFFEELLEGRFGSIQGCLGKALQQPASRRKVSRSGHDQTRQLDQALDIQRIKGGKLDDILVSMDAASPRAADFFSRAELSVSRGRHLICPKTGSP